MIRITSSIWSAQDSAQTSEEDLDFGGPAPEQVTVPILGLEAPAASAAGGAPADDRR
jgi:hypothetical protein